MEAESLFTHFDSPERADVSSVMKDFGLLSADQTVEQMLEGFTEAAVILNQYRQIINANSSAKAAFQVTDLMQILSKRLGEAIGCIHHDDMSAGCGTSRFCKECGAAKTIKQSNEISRTVSEECRITAFVGGRKVHYDFWIKASPFFYNSNEYRLIALKDISAQKRKEVLEKIFFHDVLNISGTISGASKLLAETDDTNERNALQNILISSSEQLINEINYQRVLSNAEDGALEANFSPVGINEIIEKTYDYYRKHPLALDKKIEITYLENEVTIITDETLVIRSLGNYLKNALEASAGGETIKLYANLLPDKIELNVDNDTLIPPHIQLQLFQRSFSTNKKKGRGLGLYSVKLIVEQYLNGQAYFVSDEINKTRFSICLPLENTNI